MKTRQIYQLFFTVLLLGIFVSCEKDSEYTIEDQTVTGDFIYNTTSLIPIAIDSVTQQPLAASISMDGTGTVTDMGAISILTSFKFDFVTGKGTDFVTTYSGANAADSYSSTGSSQRQPDGSITLTESFSNGKGKFAKIKGGGETKVILKPDGSGGTGSVTWKVTY